MIGVLAVPLGIFALLRRFPALDIAYRSTDVHLVVMSIVAVCVIVVAALAARPAVRTRQGPLVVLASTSTVVALLLLGHGLATPGTGGLVGPNVWVGRYPMLALPVFAIGQLLATRPHWRPVRWAARHPVASLLAPSGLTAALVVVTTVEETVLGGGARLPGEVATFQVVAVLTGVVLLGVGAQHWWWYRLGADTVQQLLTIACWVTVMALVSYQLGVQWHLSWWDYHAYLLAGFGAATAAVVIDTRRALVVDDALRSAFDVDPLKHLASSYPEALLALVAAVEARDSYTHGHSVRVAELAVRIGTRMRLSSGRLRALAQGAYLHDVGKIGIPDAILNKAGPLDADERAWIEEHPVVGAQIVGRIESLRHGLAAVRHHHERFDGEGYPDGIAGTDIALIARIVSVADVWDALVTDRAYRKAWSHQRALDYIVANSGSQFDPACVDAFVAFVGDEYGLRPGRTADDGEARIEGCHGHDQAVGATSGSG